VRPAKRASARDIGEREPAGGSGIVDFVRVRAVTLATKVRSLLVSFVAYDSNDAPDDGEQVAQAEFTQQLGFAARPQAQDSNTSKVEAVVMRDGDDAIVLLVIDKSLPVLTESDLASGETMMHGSAPSNINARVRITKNGDVTIDTNSSRAVIVNGGNKPVAHEGSSTTGHTHTITGTAGPYALSATASNATDSIAVGQGSNDVKVRDT